MSDSTPGQDNANNWLFSQLTTINSGVNKISRELASMVQKMENVTSEQTRQHERVNALEDKVDQLEENEVIRKSRWAGPKTVILTLAAAAPLAYGVYWVLKIMGAF